MAKRIQLVCNNMAVVHILSSKNAKAESIIILVRVIVRYSLCPKLSYQCSACHF